ncbi:hypothetical protein DFH28DRAFT_929342 [Melampsora americana]|nr:hypothetical protein DFH28DRAFT_929342 [Melampsora americana]
MTSAFARITLNPSTEYKASQSNIPGEEEESLWLDIGAGKTGKTVYKSSPISRRLIPRSSPFADIHSRSPSLANTHPLDSDPSDSHIYLASTGVTPVPFASTVKGTTSVRTSSKDTIQTPNRTEGQESTTGEEFKSTADRDHLDFVTAVRLSSTNVAKPEHPAATQDKVATTQTRATKDLVAASSVSTSPPSRKDGPAPQSTKDSTSTLTANQKPYRGMYSKDVGIIVVSCLVVIGCGMYLLLRKFKLLYKKNETIQSLSGRSMSPSGSSKNSITPWVKFDTETSEFSPAALEGGGGHPVFTSNGEDKALDGRTAIPDPAYLHDRPNLQRRILRRLAGISAATSSAAGAAGGRVLESFVRRQVRNDAEARLDGTQGTHSSDKMTIDEKAAQAQAGTGYVHPLGDFATLHNWGSESQNCPIYNDSKPPVGPMTIWLFEPLPNPQASFI